MVKFSVYLYRRVFVMKFRSSNHNLSYLCLDNYNIISVLNTKLKQCADNLGVSPFAFEAITCSISYTILSFSTLWADAQIHVKLSDILSFFFYRK